MRRGSAATFCRHPLEASRGVIITTCVLLASFVAACAGAANVQQNELGVSGAVPDVQKAESTDLYPIVRNGKFGFIDKHGRVVIKPQFLYAGPFPFREWPAVVLLGDIKNNKYAFIDVTGRIVIETEDSPSEMGFSSGVVVMKVKNSSSHYYMDKNGNEVAGYFDQAKDCTEGLCAVRMDSMGPRHWGYINTAGKLVVRGQYDWSGSFSEGLARVNLGDRWGYIDRAGKAITPLKFEKAWDFSDRMAQVQLGGKWGYIDGGGRLAIAPQFEESQPFNDGLARVKVNGLWGFIDRSGEIVIAPQFDSAQDFSEHWAAVAKGGKSYYIDRSGKTVLDAPFYGVGPFRNGVALFRDGDKVGLIDKTGKVLVEMQSASLEMVSEELIRVIVRDQGGGYGSPKGMGYIDYGGRYVWKPTN